MNRYPQLLFIVTGLFLVLLNSCADNARTIDLHGNIFGTTYNIKYLSTSKTAGSQIVHRAILERLGEIDSKMSTWEQDSEIIKLNKKPLNVELPISQELIEILELSVQLNQDTLGVFDISIGPLVNIWGFDDDSVPNKIPTAAEVATANERVGLEHLELDMKANTAIKRRDLWLTLGAIAKGYGVDEIGKVLEGYGVTNYLVEIGGEILAKGSRSSQTQGWRVAIEQPDEIARQSFDVLILKDLAIATSGDYRHYAEIDGIRYSHIIDPRTALPVSHRLASVSVLHPSTAYADAWATALYVLGAEDGLQLANDVGLAAYFIVRSDDEFVPISSEAFTEIHEGTDY
ncbi:MAG: FAD:protein FMN transferase [Gammaproteobacteria bacterium]|nr:FAD:protein FMN transferase [Gammaproteobacteria bacterium]